MNSKRNYKSIDTAEGRYKRTALESSVSERSSEGHSFSAIIKTVAVVIIALTLSVAVKSKLANGNPEKEAERVKNLVQETESQTTTEPVDNNGMLLKYKEAYEKNNDLVGWITIPNTSIDHPVVQAKDNEFYLRKSFYKIYDKRGTIFMENRCHIDTFDKNTVIYGHNFLDSTMFSDLERFKELDFYKSTPIVEFNTIYKSYKWKVFAVYLINVNPQDDNGYAFCYLYPFMTDDNFEEYVSLVRERSIINTNVDVEKTDKILTLSTCTRDMDLSGRGQTNARCVVLARLVRDGESLEVDTDSATLNENPKYPDIWYRANNMENPYADDVNDWVPVGVERK